MFELAGRPKLLVENMTLGRLERHLIVSMVLEIDVDPTRVG